MVKRTSFIRYYYIAFAIILLMTCWEAQKDQVVVYASPEQAAVQNIGNDVTIPKESIRLRILANSDSPSDQWVKREVRDAIVEQMNQWVQGPHTIEEAREVVRGHLPELEAVVGATLQTYGFTYDYKVELGTVPFPMKMYGNQIYPAGDYEALRVSIGKAEGQNWWCVLFPPLCFVDSDAIAKKPNVAEAAALSDSSKEDAADDRAQEKSKTVKDSKEKEGKAGQVHKASAKADGGSDKLAGAVSQAVDPQPEIHFFLWDLLKKLGSLFA